MRRRKLDPSLGLETALSKQIYDALQGEVVEEILKQARTTTDDSYWRSTMEGHSFKVEKKLLNHLYDLFEEVKEKLDFHDRVDLYVTGDSTVNAFSLAAEGEGEPHIVNVNSGLIQLMTDEELKFVLGHELGHLLNKDTALLRLIGFIFPEGAEIPISLQYKIRLWQQLSELVADRYGYLATENLGVCVSSFFKMASGLDISKMDINLEALLEDNRNHLDYFLNDRGTSTASHPVNPIRVESLHLFADANTKKELNEGMDALISILLKVGDSELDEPMAVFIATAGLIAANADGEVSEEEANAIMESLASVQMFPKAFLDSVSRENVPELFGNAVTHILDIDPSLREAMFRYMIGIVLADKEFTKKEIEFLYTMGEQVFGYSRKEAAGILAAMIQVNFVPSFEAIC